MKSEINNNINIADGKKDLFVKDNNGLISSLSIVLLQEIQRFNILLNFIKKTLNEL